MLTQHFWGSPLSEKPTHFSGKPLPNFCHPAKLAATAGVVEAASLAGHLLSPSVFIHRQWLCRIRISVELSSTADYSNTPPAYLSTDTLEMISTKFLRKDKNPGWIIINRWLLCSTVEPPPVLGPGQPGHVQTPPGQIDHVLASPGQPGHVQASPGCQPGNLLSTTCPQLKSPFPSRTCQIKQPGLWAKWNTHIFTGFLF